MYNTYFDLTSSLNEFIKYSDLVLKKVLRKLKNIFAIIQHKKFYQKSNFIRFIEH